MSTKKLAQKILKKNIDELPMQPSIPINSELTSVPAASVPQVMPVAQVASEGILPQIKRTASEYGQKAIELLGKPQKKMLQAAANKLGVKPEGDSSEDASRAIVEKLAEQMGIPEDSTAGNAAKAFAVGASEVFADPLNFIGAPAKVLGMAASKVPKTAKAIEKWAKIKEASDIAKAKNIAEGAPNIAKQVKPIEPVLKNAETAASTQAYRIAKDAQNLQNAENFVKKTVESSGQVPNSLREQYRNVASKYVDDIIAAGKDPAQQQVVRAKIMEEAMKLVGKK